MTALITAIRTIKVTKNLFTQMNVQGAFFSFLRICSLVSFQRKQKWFQIFFVNKSWEEIATDILLNTYFITVLKEGGKLFIG